MARGQRKKAKALRRRTDTRGFFAQVLRVTRNPSIFREQETRVFEEARGCLAPELMTKNNENSLQYEVMSIFVQRWVKVMRQVLE